MAEIKVEGKRVELVEIDVRRASPGHEGQRWFLRRINRERGWSGWLAEGTRSGAVSKRQEGSAEGLKSSLGRVEYMVLIDTHFPCDMICVFK